jgi:hypothetical protein
MPKASRKRRERKRIVWPWGWYTGGHRALPTPEQLAMTREQAERESKAAMEFVK